MPFNKRKAWRYLTVEQKERYLRWRLAQDPINARYAWAQNDPAQSDVTFGKHENFIDDRIDTARDTANEIIIREINKVFKD